MVKSVTKNQSSVLIEHKLQLADPWYQLVIKMLNPVIQDFNGKRFLEVGCGLGGFSIHIAKRGAKVIGVDISKKAIHEAKKLTKKLNVQNQVDFIVADAQSLPFKDQVREIVVCSEVLEHVSNYEKAFGEISRVTKRSGYVCLTVPNFISTAFFENMFLVFMGQPQDIKKLVCVEKEHIFHIFKLKKLIEHENLKTIKIQSTDFFHLPPRIRRALKISQVLKILSDRMEDYFDAHQSPLRFLGANIGALIKKD